MTSVGLLQAKMITLLLAALVIPIWPNKPDLAESFIGPNDTERRVRNVTNPTMTAYLAPQPSGAAILIAPGGGFRHLAIDKEGHDVAKFLNTLGVSAFVLQYSAGSNPDRAIVIKQSLADARQALSILHARAAEFKIDPAKTGILGFSAGGFLAADLALRGTPRPAFSIPIYPAAPPDLTVPPNAPPLLLIAAHDDPLTITGSIPLYQAWAAAKRPATLHIYQTGKHGFGFRKTGVAADSWPDLLAEWLREQSLLAK